jgi:hypothetical protein
MSSHEDETKDEGLIRLEGLAANHLVQALHADVPLSLEAARLLDYFDQYGVPWLRFGARGAKVEPGPEYVAFFQDLITALEHLQEQLPKRKRKNRNLEDLDIVVKRLRQSMVAPRIRCK